MKTYRGNETNNAVQRILTLIDILNSRVDNIVSDDTPTNNVPTEDHIFTSTIESGTLIVNSDLGVFLDYENFSPSARTLLDLENHITLPQFGLFTTSYTHETTAHLGTQFTVLDQNGNVINVGSQLSDLLARVIALE